MTSSSDESESTGGSATSEPATSNVNEGGPMTTAETPRPVAGGEAIGTEPVASPTEVRAKPISRMRRFFLMEEELARAKAEVFRSDHPGWELFTLARQLEDCSRALLDFPERQDGALLLLRDTLDLAIRARLARSGGAEHIDSASRETLWSAFEGLQGDTGPFQGLAEPERELVRQTLVAGANEQLAMVDAKQRRARTKALVRFVPPLVQSLQEETERVAQVRALRALRIGGSVVVVLAIIVIGWLSIARALRGENLALGRPVTISSDFDAARYPAHGVVDGITDTIGCHTRHEQDPWLQIDLGRSATIRRVVVYNRTDGNLSERSVPLLIEVSRDGKQYEQFDRRDSDFSKWQAGSQPREARFVRLTVKRSSFLHVNEVEVY